MASSMQVYLKRYASDADKSRKKKKKKKKTLMEKTYGTGLKIVDADPVWQNELKEESSESEDEQEDAPLIIKDVEFQRLQRLEALRLRPYLATADDGSGWVEVKENQGKEYSSSQKKLPSAEESDDLSPPNCHAQEGDVDIDSSPKRRKSRHDTPERDLSPPRGRHDTPERGLSPSRRRHGGNISLKRKKVRHDSPEGHLLPPKRHNDILQRDLSPPRRHHDGNLSPTTRGHHDTSERDISPLRRLHDTQERDLSLPRQHHDTQLDSTGWRREGESKDLSSPRRRERNPDLSPPRRMRRDWPDPSRQSMRSSPDLSPPRRRHASSRLGQHDSDDANLSPKRRFTQEALDLKGSEMYGKKKVMADGTAPGLKSGRLLAEEIDRKKLDDSRRYKELDATITGRHANTVYRDKHGKRLETFEEMLKLQQGAEPVKEEKPLEWGRGLVQKKEAEAKLAELEAEKSKPFARTRDDPDLDKHLREQVRWGDPMAHLVKNKANEPVLEDLGASEQMQESGFVVPQAVPKHSWLKRGITPATNRYGIKPGRHWDGVDRSTGFERDMFKKQNEKAAERLEAYLWSVADM